MPKGLTTIRQWLQDLAPRRFGTEWGQRLIALVGVLGDAHLEAAAQALASASPSVAPSVEALAHHARDRGIVRGPGESVRDWQRRIVLAWRWWSLVGTAEPILVALAARGLQAEILTADGTRWRAYSGNLKVIERIPGAWRPGDPARWSRFGVVIPVGGHPYTQATGVPEADRIAIRRLVEQWSPAHYYCHQITAVLSGDTWGTSVGTFGSDSGTWGDADAVSF